MSSIVDIYNGILKYNNSDIVIVIDDNNEIWFYAKQVAKILGYKSTREIIKKHVDPLNSVNYESIKTYSKYLYNVQDHATFINQSGMYELVLRSKKPTAIDFKRWLTYTVIPSIKNTGKYEMNSNTYKKMTDVNNKLKEYKKRIKVLEYNQKKPTYSQGGYVYVIKPTNIPEKTYKIGKTNNIKKRLNTYNTSLPDKMKVVYKIAADDPTAVEHCIKGTISHLQYRKNKEFYKINKKTLINVVKKCATHVKKSKSLKRMHTMNIVDNSDNNDYDDNADSDDNNKNYYAIIGVPKDYNTGQKGGEILAQCYIQNKKNYLYLTENLL